ncbi:hypothetical protein QYE76_040933 [Lolium multiflorum]|uniref:Uncharacterized protein n=1 Tax=Lolium multiflorum TaxID=4521 RepID=A0AAD8WTI1_LOLMU|nr:hypothetical protein QYE76_040933 [Lolium multiflorum]
MAANGTAQSQTGPNEEQWSRFERQTGPKGPLGGHGRARQAVSAVGPGCHLLRVGFMPNYYCWTKHGEKGVMMEGNEEEEEEDDNYPMFPEYGDVADNEDNEAEDQEAPDEPLMMILVGPLLMQG